MVARAPLTTSASVGAVSGSSLPSGFCLREYATVWPRVIVDSSGVCLRRAMPSVVPAFATPSKFARTKGSIDAPQRIASTRDRLDCPEVTTTATERVGRYQLLEPIGHGPS